MNTFLNAFMKSAAQFSLPKVEDWKEEWIAIEKCIKELGYQFPDHIEPAADSATILKALNEKRKDGVYRHRETTPWENLKMLSTMKDTCLFDTPAWSKIKQRIERP